MRPCSAKPKRPCRRGLRVLRCHRAARSFAGPKPISGTRSKSSAPAGRRPRRLAAWQQALQALRLALSDVHWEPAVILDKGGGKRGDGNICVGIRDGRVLPLNAASLNERKPRQAQRPKFPRTFQGRIRWQDQRHAISARAMSRLRDDARHRQIQAREKALGGGVLLSRRLNEEAMALGAGAGAPLTHINRADRAHALGLRSPTSPANTPHRCRPINVLIAAITLSDWQR